MLANPPENMPRITPNVFYDDVNGALEFLSKAFGFETRMSLPGPEGNIIHAEMQVLDSAIMMSPTTDGDQWASPQTQGGRVTQSLYIYVDDVDAHFAAAKSAGASIVADPEDMFWGDRTYVASDPEGHRWTFAQPVREVDPSEMQAPG